MATSSQPREATGSFTEEELRKSKQAAENSGRLLVNVLTGGQIPFDDPDRGLYVRFYITAETAYQWDITFRPDINDVNAKPIHTILSLEISPGITNLEVRNETSGNQAGPELAAAEAPESIVRLEERLSLTFKRNELSNAQIAIDQLATSGQSVIPDHTFIANAVYTPDGSRRSPKFEGQVTDSGVIEALRYMPQDLNLINSFVQRMQIVA